MSKYLPVELKLKWWLKGKPNSHNGSVSLEVSICCDGVILETGRRKRDSNTSGLKIMLVRYPYLVIGSVNITSSEKRIVWAVIKD